MADTDKSTRLRIAVVNLDQSWSFSDLVRRHALDVFADPSPTADIRFRTIGERDATPHGDKRLAVWGANRPLAYGDDWESLIADLVEDLEDLAERRFDQLAIVAVIGDPNRAASGAATYGNPIDVLRRVEEVISRDDDLLSRVQRYVCVREETNQDSGQPGLAELIDDLLADPACTGRELANQAFTLRPSHLIQQNTDAEDRQFLLLRIVIAAVVARVLDSEAASSGASQVGELFKHREPLAFAVAGAPGATRSAAIASLIKSYKNHVEAMAPTARETVTRDDPTRKKVNDTVKEISESLRGAESELGHLLKADQSGLSDEDKLSSGANDDVNYIDKEAEGLVFRSLWWTPGGERKLLTMLDDLPKKVSGFIHQRLERFEEYRCQLEDKIIGSTDASIRASIRCIPVGGGGLAGATEIHIDAIRRDVDAVRRRFEARAEEARKRLMGALLPEKKKKRSKSSSSAPEPTVFHGIDLSRLPTYAAIENIKDGLQAAYRGLLPHVYWIAWFALSAGAVLTVLAHAWGKARGDVAALPAVLFSKSGALLTAVAISAALGTAFLWLLARQRHRALRQAVDDLKGWNKALWDQVQAMTDRAFDYITISRQLVFLDLLSAELERRTWEADAVAFNLAVEDMRAPPSVVVGDSGRDAFVNEMDRRLQTLPVARWIREMLDSPSAFAATSLDRLPTLRFELREYQARRGLSARRAASSSAVFSTQSDLFMVDQTVTVAPLRDRAARRVEEPNQKPQEQMVERL